MSLLVLGLNSNPRALKKNSSLPPIYSGSLLLITIIENVEGQVDV
jgi:hypothetical protein